MPLYEYECPDCGWVLQELTQRVAAYRNPRPCDRCDGKAVPVISRPAEPRTDKPKWLASARATLQPDGERPLETRREFDNYLAQRNIVPLEHNVHKGT